MFPEWFQIFFGSMIPWIEARYVMFYAIEILGWHYWHAFPIAILGNILPIPFILLFFKYVERFLRKYGTWSRFMDWFFEKTRRRANASIKRYEHVGLLIFVALPIPFTGGWSGALIAYLFGLSFLKSLITIFAGIVIAAVIITVLTLSGQYMLSI